MAYAGQKEKKKDTLLNVAEQLMMRKGPEETSFQEIAEEAKVTRQTVVNYFGTKEKLYTALLEKDHDYNSEQIDNFCSCEAYQKKNGYEQIESLFLEDLYRTKDSGDNTILINRIKLALGNSYKRLERMKDISCVWQRLRLIKKSIDKGHRDGSIRSDVKLSDDELEACICTTQGIRLFLAQQLMLMDEDMKGQEDKMIETYVDQTTKYIRTMFNRK
ncbi:MAG: TetR/AcrR family transcriptional regulator [Blautia sp.]|nr:TetR/AcrR family transcriptional regulator [Blautia sp.]